MNKKLLLTGVFAGLVIISIYTFQGTSQITDGYVEGIESQRQEKNDEFKNSEDTPLTKEQKGLFTSLIYFPIAEKYKVRAEFHKNPREQKVKIAITDGSQREYFVFGNAHIHLEGKELNLTVYKSIKTDADYLFIPFYDETSADLTYGGGRYVEPEIIDGGTIEIDFNTAYNPYCAYNHTYRCPIPPQENNLNVSILAGEKIPDFAN
ncbi:MAG: DUF1684 domain-containing protein [Cyclobacteriaceae bacterium]|nr:DUF1684 domain-containing protein [Cyclobacteriaceae bacterium]